MEHVLNIRVPLPQEMDLQSCTECLTDMLGSELSQMGMLGKSERRKELSACTKALQNFLYQSHHALRLRECHQDDPPYEGLHWHICGFKSILKRDGAKQREERKAQVFVKALLTRGHGSCGGRGRHL